MKTLTSFAAALALAAPAFAQDDALTLEVAESTEFGHYLTDGAGRPVYAFTTDLRASDGEGAQLSCTDADCVEAWPPVTIAGTAEAGAGADADRLGTAGDATQQIVTYDGWPLYRFASDAEAGEPQGYGVAAFGGEWRLLTPAANALATDVAGAETIYANACAQCHGPGGQGMASFPSLAGNNPHYIASRLGQYRAGEAIGSNSALMRPVAAALSDDDIANLAAFIATNFE